MRVFAVLILVLLLILDSGCIHNQTKDERILDNSKVNWKVKTKKEACERVLMFADYEGMGITQKDFVLCKIAKTPEYIQKNDKFPDVAWFVVYRQNPPKDFPMKLSTKNNQIYFWVNPESAFDVVVDQRRMDKEIEEFELRSRKR